MPQLKFKVGDTAVVLSRGQYDLFPVGTHVQVLALAADDEPPYRVLALYHPHEHQEDWLRADQLAAIDAPDPAPAAFTITQDRHARKNAPLARGVLDYFAAALVAVAELSRVGNQQHNPEEEMHWARGKSSDHADCILRHLIERGLVDNDGIRHSAKVAWRALALLQEELEAAGAAPSRGSKFPDVFVGVEESAKSAAENISRG